jgi:hypothetical protein
MKLNTKEKKKISLKIHTSFDDVRRAVASWELD